ncbi:hypothetical protein Unana1_00454 [Umbelopsis nana]
MSSLSTTAFTAIPTPTVSPVVTSTNSAASVASIRMALIMAVMVASICLAGFLWQCIQCYTHFRRFNWSQLMILLLCECLMGWVFSALTLAEYLLSISCEIRAVAELIMINTGDALLQAILLHRVYAIQSSKVLLFSGISLIILLMIYVMITLAAGQLVSTAMDPSLCATQSRYVISYFVLKHLCIIFANKYQSLLPVPTGHSSVPLHQFDKDPSADDVPLNLSRLVELPAPDRRDSGMIRY